MKKVLFPDSLHFHERGFKSLMDLIKEKEIDPIFIKDYNEIKAQYGNYKAQKTLFLSNYDKLVALEKNELFQYNKYGVSIFELCKAEMLSLLMSYENWYKVDVSSNSFEIFTKAYNENKEELLLNMAATLFWLDFWKNKLKEYKKIDGCIIFSGSLIYVKTLSFLLQNTPIKVFVVEHFYTGNDFYFEEKYTHIANNSDIKFQNFYEKLKKIYKKEDIEIQEKEKIKAINKIKMANNKNVVQPKKDEKLLSFDNKNKNVLILGQVINDFSIIETDLTNINSLQWYKKIITKIIKETNYNIIFKAHPWERSKANLKRSLTKDELINFIHSEMEIYDSSRVKIIDDYNLYSLFSISDYVVGLCSQSLIEAAYYGKKPHQLGKSFFGKKGFTYDHNNINSFINTIKSEQCQSQLNIQEYENLLLFLTLMLQYHLISVFTSGKSEIIKKLTNANLNIIKLLNDQKEINFDPSINIQIKEDNEEKDILLIDAKDIKEEGLNKRFVDYIIRSLASEERYKKFKLNPKKYFYSSDKFILKILEKIYFN